LQDEQGFASVNVKMKSDRDVKRKELRFIGEYEGYFYFKKSFNAANSGIRSA